MTAGITVHDLQRLNLRLAVQFRSGEQAGRCYTRSKWTVYSTRELSDEQLMQIVPHGQEFRVTGKQSGFGYNIYEIQEATDSSD